MKAVYKELSIDDKFFPIKSAINQMSRWKDQLVSPEQALADHARDVKSTQTARIYAAYEKKLKETGAFDFDDLIYQTVQLLAEHPDVREFYQNKYRYLLVAEYQDTSVAQFRLVSLLTGPERNICVVGDDDQSIYRFRGATIENILNFEKLYPGTKTIRLEQNYRSTSNILNAANCVIQHNTCLLYTSDIQLRHGFLQTAGLLVGDAVGLQHVVDDIIRHPQFLRADQHKACLLYTSRCV